MGVVGEPGAPGGDDGLGAIGELELRQDVRDVIRDGLGGEMRGAGDGRVDVAVRNESEDLDQESGGCVNLIPPPGL